ncbi:MAG: HAD-IIB family hydrolase, partial [Pseudomonadales bacterium]
VGEELPEAHRRAVAEAHAAGIEIINATARWRQMAERISALMGIRKPIIACSGAQVYVPEGRDIFDHRLPADFVDAFYKLCNTRRCMVTVALDNNVILKLDAPPDQSRLPEELKWEPQLQAGPHGSPRAATVQGDDVVDIVSKDLRAEFVDSVNIYDAVGPDGKLVLIVTAKAASKGQALLAACQYRGINPEQVVAFGDAENDIEMFKVAGASVAMGQANDLVKSSASLVTRANTEAGVAIVIDRILRTGSL